MLERDDDVTALVAGRSLPPMRFAASLATAARDEFVYVGRDGRVRPPWRLHLRQTTTLSLAVATGAAGIGLSFLAGVPLLSLAYGLALGAIGWHWMAAGRLHRAAALVAAHRLDEADARLRDLCDTRLVPRSVRALAWHNRAVVAARRGHHLEALAHAQRCTAELERLRLSALGPWRMINRFTEAQLLAQLGRLDEARELREQLQDAPDGEYFRILNVNTDLLIAFASGSSASLPEDLFPWARLALETTSAELALALLAWAYLQRGDTDMGEHLLDEARQRIDPRLFSRSHPTVYRWLSA